MNKKRVLITQSNYIPWKGYFEAIRYVDEVILYDDMQYTKRDWRNRNKIKTRDGLKWLTIPVVVKGKYEQKINETQVSDPEWNSKHWQTIYHNYSKAPFFNQYASIFEEMYRSIETDLLSRINEQFIRAINQVLSIDTFVNRSDNFELVKGKTDCLVDLCTKVGATDYYSGPSGRNYMEHDKFEDAGIKVHYFDFSGYPEYPQLFDGFFHDVTILDLIFNTGPEAARYFKGPSLVPDEC